MKTARRPFLAGAVFLGMLFAGCGSAPKTETPPPAEPPVAEPAPAPVPQRAPEPPKMEPIVLEGDVLFDFDRSELKPEARATLDRAIALMRERPEIAYFRLSGHTDSLGSERYNQSLSQRRVDAVRDYLIANGIPAHRLRTEAYGESRPVASNDTPAGRALNRRVEIVPVVEH